MVPPTQDILIESNPFETRVAILEQGKLVEVLQERRATPSLVGNIYLARVKRVLPGMAAAFLDVGLEQDVYLLATELGNLNPGADGKSNLRQKLEAKQRWIVQVTRDPSPQKRARVTTELSLAGKYVIALPQSTHQGVSRQIDDDCERRRLRQALSETCPEGIGWIARTAAQGQPEARLQQELDRLVKSYTSLLDSSKEDDTPRKLHTEDELGLRAIRELTDSHTGTIEIEGSELAENILQRQLLGDDLPLVKAAPGLFERRKIEAQIDAALLDRVWLPKGGSIVLQATEAMVSIDVNTGSYVGKGSLEQTALRTNLIAAEEIARQVRLRNLGGILVIDFIDMSNPAHRHEVVQALRTALRRDRAKTRVLGVSEFGLVEVTRKRSRATLGALLTRQCPTCKGSGRVRSLGTLCLDIRRRILRQEPIPPRLVIEVNPVVERALRTDFSQRLAEIASETRTQLELRPVASLNPSDFHLSKG